MHKPVPSLPSCCDNPDKVHEAMGTAGHDARPGPLPEKCCDGRLCLDSAAPAPELTAAMSSIESGVNAPPDRRNQATFVLSTSSVKPYSELDIKGPPVPVYIRTCVFLI
jgi:hypothetical protein